MHYIYLIQNQLDHKIYVGQTRNLKNRWRQHQGDSKSAEYPLYRAMRKHGIDNFAFQDIEAHETQDEANEAEVFFIQYFGTLNPAIGYNLRTGGSVSSHSAESIEKMKATWTPERIAKQAAERTGKALSQETKRKMALAATGRVMSPDAIEKIRLARTGKKRSPESIEKFRQTQLGKPSQIKGRPFGPTKPIIKCAEAGCIANGRCYVNNIKYCNKHYTRLFRAAKKDIG